MTEQWMSIAEAAAAMKIHPRTVERRAGAGKLDSRRNDDGQVQVLVPVNPPEPHAPSPEPVSAEAFETVREMADRQVDIAAGSASALVRAAQEQAMRAEHQTTLARQEAGRYRRETQAAMLLVAVVLLAVIVAVGYCTSTITAARVDAQNARQAAAAAADVVKRATDDAASARDQIAAAKTAQARAEGALAATNSGIETVIRQTRPATRPLSVVDRIAAAFRGE